MVNREVRTPRRKFLAGIGTGLLAGLAGCSSAAGSPGQVTLVNKYPIPDTEVRFEYNKGTGTVAIYHASGEPLTVGLLWLISPNTDFAGADGYEWVGEQADRNGGGAGPTSAIINDIEAGEKIWDSAAGGLGAVESGTELRLVWVTGSGRHRKMLGTFTVP